MIELYVKHLTGLNKIRGLINESKPHLVYFQTRFGIHTFGLKFPIDVLILDRKGRVVKIRENLKPNRIFIWNPIYKKIVELPTGKVTKYKITKNDHIKLTFIK